jgi:hypothetical protein
VKARDPREKETLEAKSSADTVDRSTLGACSTLGLGGSHGLLAALEQHRVGAPKSAATPAQVKTRLRRGFWPPSETLKLSLDLVGVPTFERSVLELRTARASVRTLPRTGGGTASTRMVTSRRSGCPRRRRARPKGHRRAQAGEPKTRAPPKGTLRPSSTGTRRRETVLSFVRNGQPVCSGWERSEADLTTVRGSAVTAFTSGM